jgi:hypothetical protein
MTAEKVLDEGNWRFEYKYRLPIQQYLQVRNAFEPFMQLDHFTLKKPEKKYLIRSLYYESFFFDSFEEKIDGNCDRIKLRIRTYSEIMDPSFTIRAEMKVRKGAVTEKYGSLINPDQYIEFQKNNHWTGTSDPILEEFERYVHLQTLSPQLLIEYYREGFESRAREDIRITFDHDVKSSFSHSLFPKNALFNHHHNGIIILEIKCTKQQPDWLRTLVQKHGLRIMANSKYVQGIVISHPALVTPSWSA